MLGLSLLSIVYSMPKVELLEVYGAAHERTKAPFKVRSPPRCSCIVSPAVPQPNEQTGLVASSSQDEVVFCVAFTIVQKLYDQLIAKRGDDLINSAEKGLVDRIERSVAARKCSRVGGN